MPLRIVRSASNQALWAACRDRFLEEIGERRGPGGFPSHLWVVHRSQRDALLAEAARRDLPGWLDPPFAFLSELPQRFGIRERPIGLLTGRLLVARLAARNYLRAGLGGRREVRGPARAHVLDALFGELLPEGTSVAELRAALAGIDGDSFARKRDDWIVDTYEEFLAELEETARYDPRSVHALLAARIEAGSLPGAIGGADRLHVYGLVSTARRRRLVRALAAQDQVDVVVYLPAEDGISEWDEMLRAAPDEILPDPGPALEVRSVADARAEAAWVAAEVKRVVVDEQVPPHEVAVVARSGGADVRRVEAALREAGVEVTVRTRVPLAEVAALRAVLGLLEAAARGWGWRELRPVLASPFFDVDVDLRPLDFLARERRVTGVEEWRSGLDRLRVRLGEDEGRWLRREGIWEENVDEAIAGLSALERRVADLHGEKIEAEWIDVTLSILRGRPLDLRSRASRPAADRWDLVRLDQQGILALEALLAEWRELGGHGDPMDVEAWHDRLRRLLEANELALTTPVLTGVQLLEAHEAALSPFRRVFLIHANDGAFPRSWSPRGVFSDDEARTLRAAGLPLPTREEALRRERALWAAVTAGQQVTVTWRAAGPSGEPLLPTLLLEGADIDGTGPVGTEREPTEGDGEAVPASLAARLRLEAEELAALRRSGDTRELASVDPDALRHAVLAAWTEEIRGGGLDAAGHPWSLRPHPWNGHLRDPVVLDELARRFGDDRVWSASQLEQYGRRPFDFLVERVLRLSGSEEADEATAPAQAGTLAHGVLEAFYQRCSGDPPRAFDAPAERLLEEVSEEVFRRAEESDDVWLGSPALWQITRERVRDELRAYLGWELPYMAEKGERPVRVELSFGEEESEAVRLAGKDASGTRRSLLLRGRVDRVDRIGAGDAAVLRVLDYKRGRPPPRGGHDDGSVLQTALYQAAVEAVTGEAVDAARYRSIRSPGSPADGALLKREDVPRALAFAFAIPPRVREGLFEAVQAAAWRKVLPWQFDRTVTRSAGTLPSGSRFDTDAGADEGSDVDA